jgi:hypothetical protein
MIDNNDSKRSICFCLPKTLDTIYAGGLIKEVMIKGRRILEIFPALLQLAPRKNENNSSPQKKIKVDGIKITINKPTVDCITCLFILLPLLNVSAIFLYKTGFTDSAMIVEGRKTILLDIKNNPAISSPKKEVSNNVGMLWEIEFRKFCGAEK